MSFIGVLPGVLILPMYRLTQYSAGICSPTQHLRKAEHAIEYGHDLLQVAKDACDALNRVPVDRSVRKPKIGIIGETYVRGNEFSNNFIVRTIEKLGGTAVVPPFSEWLDYPEITT